MPLYSLDGLSPELPASGAYFVAPDAHVIGRVRLGEEVGVWFGAVLRGDNDPITIGTGSNVQENAVLHTEIGQPLIIGQYVTVGHQAMLHGCTIGDGSLIGMQAIVLNGARIGRECLIGAGALIPEGKVIPDRSVVMGAPGKVVRELSDEDVARIQAGVESYITKSAQFSAQLKRIDE